MSLYKATNNIISNIIYISSKDSSCRAGGSTKLACCLRFYSSYVAVVPGTW